MIAYTNGARQVSGMDDPRVLERCRDDFEGDEESQYLFSSTEISGFTDS